MDADTLTAVRLEVYRRFLADGEAPSAEDVAFGLGLGRDEIEAAFRELEAGRVLVFEPGSLDIWMAQPLSTRPTDFRVTTERGAWWAACAWDAFGVSAMLGEDAQIATADPATGELLELRVEAGRPAGDEAIVHFSVPARRWWDDIGYS